MKLLSNTLHGLAILLLLGVAGLFIASMIPIPGNIEIKIVKSGSMEPTIPTGSLVVIKPSASYVVGNIVTFGEDTRSQIPTTHRIIAIDDDLITTKGDANEEADTRPVRRHEIIGKVVGHAPYAGFVLDFAKQPLGFVLLIAIPAATIIIDELINIFREVRAAWRRRDRDEGPHSGSGTSSEDVETHVIFARRFSMDDVFVPLRVIKARATRRLVSHRQYVNASVSGIAVFAVISLSTGGTASTLSFFRDTEQATQNILGAGEWGAPMQPLIDNARFFSASTQEDEVLGDELPIDEPALEQPGLDPTQEETPSDAPSDIPVPPTDETDIPAQAESDLAIELPIEPDATESVPRPPAEEPPPPPPEELPPPAPELPSTPPAEQI
ncbi:MAG: signal peptidase I [Candidatus Pacebacteria bacterium]|nr:signal peptidase I [Candidatus Paceibacterota bacterium]